MNDRQLRSQLDQVSRRYRVLYRTLGLAVLWLTLGLACGAALQWLSGGDFHPAMIATAIVAVCGLALIPLLIFWTRQAADPLWLARRLERRHPDLDARLLAALEQHPGKTKGLGFLQEMVIDQAVIHALKNQWTEVVPTRGLRLARLANWGLFLAFVPMAIAVGVEMARAHGSTPWSPSAQALAAYTIKVEPEDTTIERGTALLVMARFGNARLPGEVNLLYRDGDGEVQSIPMSKSLDDPLFATRIASVKRDGTYAVHYGNSDTRWYKVSVFDYPRLRQADAELKFPSYTGLEDRTVQDTRSVSGVEGTHVTFTFHMNKPVADARLVPTRRPAENLATQSAGRPAAPSAGAAATVPAVPLALTADPKDPTAYTLSLDLAHSQTYQLQLVDAEHRTNREQAQMTINVTLNRPPDLKVTWPNRDLDVSPLEEIQVKAQVWDDYGVKRVGVTYAIAGQPPKDVILAENVPGKEHRDISQVISLEDLRAEPDQLLSYHLWAEDIGPDGKVRRTQGAMYFADVRPFEEIYRQGEALAAGQEDQQQQRQQQQQQQGQQGGQNAQRAEQVASTLRQVIAATWNILRRETAETPSPQFVPDVTSVENSQARIREQTEGMGDQVTDERSQAFLDSGLKNIDNAQEQLKAAADAPAVKPLPDALSFEQAAYQDLLKLRAREFEVTQGNRQQGNQNASQARRQQQVNQMNLANQNNPYQSRRNAQQQQQPQQNQQNQQETDAQRETRQVLSRLRDLAQRQDDINRQMRELQSALQQAQDQTQRDEIQRQLANLREQQQQQLRDADELRDRMDQPQNQEQMADARQQLDQTRDSIQQASQNMNNGQMQQAAAAGQRASEQLNNLQNQMRAAAAGQFGEAMTQMRQDARNLEQNQQQVDQRLADLNQPTPAAPTGLRNTAEQDAAQQRQQAAQDLAQQREQLQNLLNNMQQTIEQADTPQPLLSRQLYDTYRQTQQAQPDQALDTSRRLVQQGLLREARQTDSDASQAVTRLREGVDQAATTVLGDETTALRRARDELDALAQQLDRERGRAATQASTQPDRGGAGQLAAATQSNDRQLAGNATRPGARGGGQAGTQPGDRQLAQDNPQGRRGGQPGARGGAQTGTQPGDEQLAQNGAQGRRGGQSGARGGAQAGTQPGDEQLAQNGAQGRRGGQPGARGGAEAGTQPGDEQLAQNGAQGRRGGQAGARGGAQAGTQPGGENGSSDTQPQDQLLARGLRGAPGLRPPGQNNQANRGGGRGQPNDATQPNDPQLADAQAGQQPDPQQDPQGGQAGRGARGQRGGQARGGGATQPGDPQIARGGRQGTPQDIAVDGGANGGPITGDGYRYFTDTLRDVEEMVDDPQLRAQAANIRQNTTALRLESIRSFRPPAWNIVQDTLNRPLTDLRNAVSQEIQKRESAQAAVPLDRDAVPPGYQDQVRTYYERLGSGQ